MSTSQAPLPGSQSLSQPLGVKRLALVEMPDRNHQWDGTMRNQVPAGFTRLESMRATEGTSTLVLSG